MKQFLRPAMAAALGLAASVVLGLALAVSAAWAIEYDDVIELTRSGVSDRTIVEMIVEDGRAFGMSEAEIAGLREQGVSQLVIDVMLDPGVGQAWLEANPSDESAPYSPAPDAGGSGGYSTDLDHAYGQGYNDGYSQGQSTALVYSFGYYYGPLARYYYCDPFYYPFFFSGYAYSYWPSYCAFYWRPAYNWCYAYPYNYYSYNSFYCHSYYDPGYWQASGYAVQPGYGRTVWDDGPRWRGGGQEPAAGGRSARVIDGRFVDSRRTPAGTGIAPPPIREAVAQGGDASLRSRANRLGQPGRTGAISRTTPDGTGRIASGRTGSRPGAPGRIVADSRVVRGRPVGRVTQAPENPGGSRLIRPGTSGSRGGRSGGGGYRLPARTGEILRGNNLRGARGLSGSVTRNGMERGAGRGRLNTPERSGGSSRILSPGRSYTPGRGSTPSQRISPGGAPAAGRSVNPGRVASAPRMNAGGGGGGGGRQASGGGGGGGVRGGGGGGGGARSAPAGRGGR